MKPAAFEFSRPLPVDRVPAGGSHEKLEAEPEECQALAARLGVPAVHRLSADLHVTPWRGGGLKVEGSLTADLDRVSVVSLEAFRSTVTYPVERYFLAGAPRGGEDEEAEADPIVNGEADLGEVVAETLALELDPYPRKPGETFPEHVESQEQTSAGESPFAALSRLKRE